MEINVDRYIGYVISALLLALNAGCIFLFYMIETGVGGSPYERSALSFIFQYLSWIVFVLFLMVLISSRIHKITRDVAIVLTLLNFFAVIGGVVCSMPFLLAHAS